MNSSVQTYARVAGVLFLLSIVGGGFGEAIAPSQAIVPGDPTATAHHIISNNTLFRIGFAAFSIESLCDTALAAVLYLLIRPVSRGVALIFMLFHLMATATFAFSEIFYFAPAFLLGGDSYLKSFPADQLNTLSLLSLNVYGFAGVFSEVYYGVASILFGLLVVRCGYLPSILGIVWLISGAGFVTQVYATILTPSLPTTYLQLPTIVAVLGTMTWLLAKGVDVPKWEARARLAEAVAV
jgi:Domain of unknown function (DUF4386)